MADVAKWMYIDNKGDTKGPVAASTLEVFLEKNVVVNGGNLVWTQGMENWKPLAEVEPFAGIVKFHNTYWHFVDEGGVQKGPVLTRMLLHKLKEGDVDGFTLVYSQEMGKWAKISEVPELRLASQKIMQADDLLEQQKSAISAEQLVFCSDAEEVSPAIAYQAMLASAEQETKSSEAASADSHSALKNKSFRADNGIKYYWDDLEKCWVEDEDQGESDHDQDAADNGSDVDDKSVDEQDVPGANEDEMEKKPDATQKRKRNKKKKVKKTPNYWVYITGLPLNITLEEVKDHFSKVGLIALNPTDQTPKIKLYKNEDGSLKGDASICYNAEESVQMAVDFLSGGYIRPSNQVTVSRAEFGNAQSSSQHRETGATDSKDAASRKRPRLTHAQVKVAMTAMQQALSWNEDDDTGVSKSKALKIVVLQNLFDPSELEDPTFEDELEEDIAKECYKCGDIEKITVFSKNPLGVVIVKFNTSFAAQKCIELMHGRYFGGKQIKCFYWDGSTDYSATSASQLDAQENEEKKRLDEFGDWLEQDQEDLPDEFQLRVER